MEQMQRELIIVLVRHIFDLGLISQATYSGAVELVHTSADLPKLFRESLCPREEECAHERTQASE